MTTRQQRQELARFAPDFPVELPAQLRGKPQPLTRIVEPFVEKRFKDDENFRKAAASLNPENSPNGRVCFDDRDLAAAVKADGIKAGVQRIIDAALGELSTAIMRIMSKRGVGRKQRLAEARSSLLLGSSQPAE